MSGGRHGRGSVDRVDVVRAVDGVFDAGPLGRRWVLLPHADGRSRSIVVVVPGEVACEYGFHTAAKLRPVQVARCM